MRLFYSAIYKLISVIHPLYWVLICKFPKVTFWGLPILDIHRKARLEIGEETTINSRNRGYHISMHSPCKLMADAPGSKICIGKKCRIHGTCIHAKKSITIGDRCLIAANTQIMDSNGHISSFDKPLFRLTKTDEPKEIDIGNDVWIGANCIIMKGNKIGSNVIIQAGSILPPNGTYPDNCLIGGNPARILANK